MIIVFSFILVSILPWWWSFVFASFGVAFIFNQNGLTSFWFGFLALFLLWGVWSAYLGFQNGGELMGMITNLFQLPSGLILMLASSVFAGILSGLAAVSGTFLNDLLLTKEKIEQAL